MGPDVSLRGVATSDRDLSAGIARRPMWAAPGRHRSASPAPPPNRPPLCWHGYDRAPDASAKRRAAGTLARGSGTRRAARHRDHTVGVPPTAGHGSATGKRANASSRRSPSLQRSPCRDESSRSADRLVGSLRHRAPSPDGGVAPRYASAMADPIAVLRSVPLFASVSDRDLKSLAKVAHEMSYPEGKKLTAEDESGATFFIVLAGEAIVSVAGEERRRLGPGDYFGEMALIDQAPRSADVVAASPLRCLVFTQWTFRGFLQSHPDVSWSMLEALVRRLREVERT